MMRFEPFNTPIYRRNILITLTPLSGSSTPLTSVCPGVSYNLTVSDQDVVGTYLDHTCYTYRQCRALTGFSSIGSWYCVAQLDMHACSLVS